MKKFLKSKKVLVAAAMATILAIGGATYAWFTWTGAAVAAGGIGMGTVEIGVSNLQVIDGYDGEYDPDLDDFVVTPNWVDFNGVADVIPGQKLDLKYTVTVPDTSQPVWVDLGLVDYESITFAALELDELGNPIWSDADDRTFDKAEIAADDRFNSAEIAVTLDLAALAAQQDLVDGSLMIFSDAASGRLFAMMQPGTSVDVAFAVEFPAGLNNYYQLAALNFVKTTLASGADVYAFAKAVQVSDDDVAAIDVFGYDINAAIADGSLALVQ